MSKWLPTHRSRLRLPRPESARINSGGTIGLAGSCGLAWIVAGGDSPADSWPVFRFAAGNAGCRDFLTDRSPTASGLLKMATGSARSPLTVATFFLGLLAAAQRASSRYCFTWRSGVVCRLAGWQRSGVFAVLLLAVFGFVLMDPSNGDYQTFGPAWLNVSMFSSLYLIMGFLTSQIYEAGIRRDVTARILAARAPVRIPFRDAASTALAGFGLLIMSGIAFLGAAALFLLVLVGLVAWFANRLIFASGREWNLYLPRVVQPLGLIGRSRNRRIHPNRAGDNRDSDESINRSFNVIAP